MVEKVTGGGKEVKGWGWGKRKSERESLFWGLSLSLSFSLGWKSLKEKKTQPQNDFYNKIFHFEIALDQKIVIVFTLAIL